MQAIVSDVSAMFPPNCPACGQSLPPDLAPTYGWLRCPACGAQFAAATEDAPAETLDYADAATPPDRRGDFTAELDGLRVRQIAALRRGAYRTRSYCFVAAAALAVVGVQLVVTTVRGLRSQPLWAVGYGVLAALALVGFVHFARRVIQLTDELRHSPTAALPPPGPEPDFSTLSDGSQQWKNLEDVR
jgi:hypothetical protein